MRMLEKSCLLLSPIKALDQYAIFNVYTADFNAFSPVDFYHIVTMYIPNGSQEQFDYIQFIVSEIGVYIKGKKALNTENHCISSLVATNLKFFDSIVDLQIWNRL